MLEGNSSALLAIGKQRRRKPSTELRRPSGALPLSQVSVLALTTVQGGATSVICRFFHDAGVQVRQSHAPFTQS